MESIPKNKTPGKYIKQNNNPRYHYLDFPDDISISNTQIIDFKHYFTVNVDYLIKNKEQDFICRVSELYREEISQRFSNFLSRIGLPK